MRDQLRNAEHWDKMNKSYDFNWQYHSKLLSDVMAQNGEDSIGVYRARLMLTSDCLGHVCDLYSAGAPIAEIDVLFPTLAELYTKTWNSDNSYIDLLWVISLGYLLGSANDQIAVLGQKLESDNYRDTMIDLLLNDIMKRKDGVQRGFLFANPYAILVSAASTESKTEATAVVKDYLQNRWYTGHSQAGWYGSHKKKNGFYHGYWSFEAGAVVKFLGLDDSGWESLSYYPYDLVHYKK